MDRTIAFVPRTVELYNCVMARYGTTEFAAECSISGKRVRDFTSLLAGITQRVPTKYNQIHAR